MYDFREEAIRALAPEQDRQAAAAVALETWPFEHLTVSYSAGLTHVGFQGMQAFGEDAASGLRDDFAQLADKLVKNSKVLLDFAGVTSFCAACRDALALFHQRLRTKGSRMVLCSLEPTARECFFPSPVQHEP
jgi:hypothetical protein